MKKPLRERIFRIGVDDHCSNAMELLFEKAVHMNSNGGKDFIVFREGFDAILDSREYLQAKKTDNKHLMDELGDIYNYQPPN